MNTSTNSHKKVLVKIFLILIFTLINSTGNTRATSRNSGSQPSLGFVGSWVATYTCNNKEVYGLLTINKSSSTLKIIGSNNLAVLKFEDPDLRNSKSLELIADKWLYKPDSRSRNFQSIDISATIEDSGLVLNGKIKGQPSCANFIAYKYKSYGKNDIKKGKIKLKKTWKAGIKMPVIKIKFNGRKHDLFGKKNKSVDNKQCIYLYEWQSKNRVKTIGNRQRFTLDSAVSNDDSMFNIFGKTYDNWTSDDATAYTKMFNDCRKQLSRSAKTNVSKLLYASSNRSALKSLSAGLRNRKSTNSRVRRTNHSGYEKYSNVWLSNFYSIASARAANTYTNLKIEKLLNQQSKNKYAQTIKEINSNKGIMSFLSDNNKMTYIQQLGGSEKVIAKKTNQGKKTPSKRSRRGHSNKKSKNESDPRQNITEKPELRITKKTYYVRKAQHYITGQVKNAVSLAINSRNYTIKTDGYFSKEVQLSKGINKYLISVENSLGIKTSMEVILTFSGNSNNKESSNLESLNLSGSKYPELLSRIYNKKYQDVDFNSDSGYRPGFLLLMLLTEYSINCKSNLSENAQSVKIFDNRYVRTEKSFNQTTDFYQEYLKEIVYMEKDYVGTFNRESKKAGITAAKLMLGSMLSNRNQNDFLTLKNEAKRLITNNKCGTKPILRLMKNLKTYVNNDWDTKLENGEYLFVEKAKRYFMDRLYKKIPNNYSPQFTNPKSNDSNLYPIFSNLNFYNKNRPLGTIAKVRERTFSRGSVKSSVIENINSPLLEASFYEDEYHLVDCVYMIKNPDYYKNPFAPDTKELKVKYWNSNGRLPSEEVRALLINEIKPARSSCPLKLEMIKL